MAKPNDGCITSTFWTCDGCEESFVTTGMHGFVFVLGSLRGVPCLLAVLMSCSSYTANCYSAFMLFLPPIHHESVIWLWLCIEGAFSWITHYSHWLSGCCNVLSGCCDCVAINDLQVCPHSCDCCDSWFLWQPDCVRTGIHRLYVWAYVVCVIDGEMRLGSYQPYI